MDTFAGFLSYVHDDDEHEGGGITLLRERLEKAVRFYTGHRIRIFQDRQDIAWGTNWKAMIDGTLGRTMLLLPVITPSYFFSKPCLDELRQFQRRQKALGRDDLILPLYYLTADPMGEEATATSEAAEAASVLRASQYADWRSLRGTAETDPAYKKQIECLAKRFGQALQRAATPPPPSRPPPDEAAPDPKWAAPAKVFGTRRMASLTLDELRPGNDSDWYLHGSLKLGTYEHLRQNGPPVYIGLRQALLTVETQGCRVAYKSMIGERATHDCFRSVLDSFETEVFGPRKPGECLAGDPLGDDFIARIEPAAQSKGQQRVTVSLYACGRSFAVSFGQQPPDCDASDVAQEEKDAILNAFIKKLKKNQKLPNEPDQLLLAQDWRQREQSE